MVAEKQDLCNLSVQDANLGKIIKSYLSADASALSIRHLVTELLGTFKLHKAYLCEALSISPRTLYTWRYSKTVKPNFKNYLRVFSLYCLIKNLSKHKARTVYDANFGTNKNID